MMNVMRCVLILLITLKSMSVFSQLSVPYYNNFDATGDDLSWSHYAIAGTDDWEMGIPLYPPYSAPGCFVTGIDGSFEGNSNRALETPSFDLSNLDVDYSLSFYHKRQAVVVNNYYYLEYSLDNGATWILLDNPTTQKKNWQTTGGFTNNFYSSFQHSAINLSFIQGNGNVKFRFRFQSGAANGQGWTIDNFSIAEESYNVTAYQGDSIFISQKCLQFNVSSVFGFYNQYTDPFYNATHYYFSYDDVLDEQDMFLGTGYTNTPVSMDNYTYEVNLADELNMGEYYILYQHDALDSLDESNELDNIGYAILEVDTVFPMPYVEDFEDLEFPWKVLSPGENFGSVWEYGFGYRHHLEGAHSGSNAWHTGKTMYYTDDINNSNSHVQYLLSPTIDLTSDTGNIVMNVWFKNDIQANAYLMERRIACDVGWSTLFTFPGEAEDEWDFYNKPLNSWIEYNTMQFRVKFTSSYIGPEGIIFDDVYVGRAKPDLTIEQDKSDRFASSSILDHELKYYFFNAGVESVDEVTTSFYWSTDDVWDAGDLLLGVKTESNISPESRLWTSFNFQKPTLDAGTYYVFYVIDETNVVDEMREYNNDGYFTLFQYDITNLPYVNDFESDISNWRHEATLGSDDWFYGEPQGDITGMAFSGVRAWMTSDSGLVSPMSRMHLYTPVFDMTALEHPVLEFDMILGLHPDCQCQLADLNMSYSIDGGATWQILDTTNTSYNRWYYPIEYESGVDQNYYLANSTYLMFDQGEKSFVTTGQYNSRDASRNTRYILDLTFLQSYTAVQFRYNLATKYVGDSYTDASVDGLLIDNFSIREAFLDLTVEYHKHLMISSMSDQLRFFMHVKNNGNYISNPAVVQYYLSVDPTLDGADFPLGQFNLTAIRPDLNRYVNVTFDGPGDLSTYAYLLYHVDYTGTNEETDELNNIGFWTLSLDSISDYPYAHEFNESIVHGWHQYAVGPFDDNLIRYRWRNMTAPAEALYQSAITSGQWFTEPVASGNLSYRPTFYLESPAFDFSGSSVVQLTFALMCTGQAFQQVDGGNMQYSLDGGNTWSVLDDEYNTADNWYDFNNLSELDNEPGWTGPPLAYGVPDFDTVHVNVSFLGGESHVVFRYKYRSNHYYYGVGNVQGMRLDDFMLESWALDYVANDVLVPLNLSVVDANIDLNYSISCSGEANGLPTGTTFYWSTDDVLDANDILLQTLDELPIANGATLNAMTSVEYPTPITQSVYYVFYVADGEFDINEMVESNNVGSFVITFTDFDHVLEDELMDGVMITSGKGEIWISDANNALKGSSSVEIFDAYGKCILDKNMVITAEKQSIDLPTTLASGVYRIRVKNDGLSFTESLYLSN